MGAGLGRRSLGWRMAAGRWLGWQMGRRRMGLGRRMGLASRSRHRRRWRMGLELQPVLDLERLSLGEHLQPVLWDVQLVVIDTRASSGIHGNHNKTGMPNGVPLCGGRKRRCSDLRSYGAPPGAEGTPCVSAHFLPGGVGLGSSQNGALPSKAWVSATEQVCVCGSKAPTHTSPRAQSAGTSRSAA